MAEEQNRIENLLLANREAFAAQIEEGFAQAERGELVDFAEAICILQERRAHRGIALPQAPRPPER